MERKNRLTQNHLAANRLQGLEGSIGDRFEEQVQKSPQSMAAVSKNYQWTYETLNSRANAAARHLLDSCGRGVERIALLLEHDAPAIAGILAVVKLGKTYVPLDPTSGSYRLRYILEDARVQAILTNDKNWDLAEEIGRGKMAIANLDRIETTTATDNLALSISPSAPVYILYTSGSTGEPKGVVQNHRNVLHSIATYSNNLQITARDRLTLLSAYGFEAAVKDIFAALLNGGTLFPFDLKQEPLTSLGQWLNSQGITIYHSTPTVYRHFIGTLSTKDLPPDTQFPKMRLVVLGGEEVVKADVEDYKKYFEKNCIFVNLLGCTESALNRLYLIDRETEIEGNTVPVGYGVDSETEILLLDEAGNPTESYGEIAIASPYLALGYWQKPELTEAVFLPDPAGGNRRIYRTGDLGRLRPDGMLELLGRKDFQVKIRGFRVEPGEVEAILGQHHKILETAVVYREDIPGEGRLVAYIVAAPDRVPDAGELHGFLSQRLPDYMVPSAFAILDALPLTPNGKIDRRALPMPGGDRPNLGTAYVAPQTETEAILAGIWQSVLRVNQVGRNDNFLELGGHSLLATQIVSRIQGALNIELSVSDLFSEPTVAAIALRVDRSRQQETDALPTPQLGSISRPANLPLSFFQEQLWFLTQLHPDLTAYNQQITIDIRSQLEVEVLQQSLQEILRRHEALRTNFREVNGEVMAIATAASLQVRWFDLRALPERERDAEALRLGRERGRQCFDLSLDLPLRATLVQLTDKEYKLFLSVHHINYDGFSLSILVRELAALYRAFSAGKPSPLPALDLQSADFAIWQRNWMAGERLSTGLDYWKERLGGGLPILQLPCDRPRGTGQSFRGARERVVLSRELSEAIASLSRRSGATLYMTLLAAFLTLLYRYSGQEDIVVGTASAIRDRPGIENLIGYFVNMLVLRTDLSGNPSFQELLVRVREVTLGAYAHQDIPFSKLVEALEPERNLSHNPLFQVAFDLNPPVHSPDENWTISRETPDIGTAKFDLLVALENQPSGIIGHFEYNRDLFDADTIRRMVGHYQTLLAGIVANPEGHLSDLPLLTASERHQLLVEWNDTRTDYPRDKCIHQLFEERVERTPDAVAVVCENEELTYRELNDRANQLAHYLQSLGVGPEERVGIYLDRSINMVVAVMGAMKAGGAYIPLDPQWPIARVERILSSQAVGYLATEEKYLPTVGELRSQLPQSIRGICLDAENSWSQMSGQNPGPVASSDNTAYIIYTSGSTGVPKGVIVRHQPAVNLIDWVNKTFQVGGGDRVLFATSLCFDLSVYDIFGLLAAGGSIQVASESQLQNPQELVRLLEREPITFWDSAPAALQQLVPFFPSTTDSPLRLVFLSGDWIPVTLPERIKAVFPRVLLVGLGGATEATIWSNYYPIEAVEPDATSIPYGKPIQNARYYILDESFNPSPIGVTGFLYIGGECLAAGYDDPVKTAEKFIRDPFGDRSGDRLYNTGDLARYLPDGNIEFIGRIDNQVKIRGFRIELGEIETTLAQHPDLREVVVIAREELPGDKRLVAYLVPRETFTTVRELRSFLKTQLPDYMVPSAFVTLDSLPLTPNGKIDRRGLPAPDISSASETTFAPPNTPTAELLAGIWSQVLGIEKIGINDNFFELGGHSLKATQVISRIRETFSLEMPLRQIFESPTVGQLAKVIETYRQTTDAVSATTIAPRSADAKLALSFAQERLWFLGQLEGESAAYNMVRVWRVEGELSVKSLELAFSEIIRRHEILRTTFKAEQGVPIPVIASTMPSELPVIDLQHLPEAEQSAAVQRLVAEEGNKPFDLAIAPLLRVTLLQLSRKSHVLTVAMHHIISDGWSMGIFWQSLSALYDAFSRGQNSPLADLPVQYADYALWQRERFRGQLLETQLNYWKQKLAGAPPLLELPTDRPRPSVQTFTGEKQSLSLSQTLSQSIKALSLQAGVTVFMTLLAAFKILLSRYTSSKDIVLGTPVAGRDRPEIEGAIGLFLNTVVLRTDLNGNPTVRELLGRIREATLGAYEHRDMPFEKLVEELQPERNQQFNPLFQVWFNLLNLENVELELSGLKVERISLQDAWAKFDLTLYLLETNQNLKLDLVYNADLFDRARMEEMLHQYRHLLAQIAANPQIETDDLSLVTPQAEQILPLPVKTLKGNWGEVAHGRFSQQAQKHPQKLAVIDAQNAWTYRELETRSNRLANYLLANGIGSQDIVAIYANRSASLVWAILAILKAGAAFTILDPAYPAARSIECLRVAKPRGWLQIGETPPPGELQEFVSSLSCSCSAIVTPNLILEGIKDDVPQAVVNPDDLAYVAFTSGSTGKPKGIKGTHKPLSHFLQWHGQEFGFDGSDRFSMVSGLSHDPLLRDIFTPLWFGATLCIPEQQDIETPGKLARWMQQQQISATHLTPAMAQLLCETSLTFPSLGYVFFGGDVLTGQDVTRIQKLAPNATCANFYGATETPQAVGYFVIPELADAQNIPLGRGIAEVQLLVLTRDRQLAGIGELGEIYVRTPYLAQGYLGAVELTEEKFIVNPFTEAEGDRLYKTGDLGRYLPDGNIEFVRRIDNQVKIRGFRIEPGEIEATLTQHPDIREAVVIAREDDPGDKRLVAYIVPGQTVPTFRELRSFGKQKLPDYMVPSAFVCLESLPLTPNGKIDRSGLPAPDISQGAETTFVPPSSPTEELLVGVWSQVLGIEKIGVRDNFFALGGHSLKATQVISRIQEVFCREFPLRHLFESPTVAELALVIDTTRQGAMQTPAIAPRTADAKLALSFAQERLWFLDRLEVQSATYNMAGAWQIEGKLSIPVLEQALQEIVNRHEILRTAFVTENGVPMQAIAPRTPSPLSVIDLQQLSEAERETEVRRLVAEAAERPFDLAIAPLLRVTLLQLSPQSQVLMLTMHHIISDAWSVGVFWDELSVLYQAFSSGQKSPLANTPIQYADYALWQREWFEGNRLSSQLDYWREQLADAPPLLELPLDRPRPSIQTFRGTRESFHISAELTQKLQNLSQKSGCTLFMTLLAAWSSLLYRYSGQSDILVGTPIANRNQRELESLIGFFVNTLVLRTQFSKNMSFAELLQAVRQTAIEAYARQDLPFEQLVQELQPSRSLSYNPLFQVAFALQNAPTGVLELPGLTCSRLRRESAIAKFDLFLQILETESGLICYWEYNSDLFDRATIRRWIGHFQVLLSGIVANPQELVDRLPLLTAREREQLLVEWNDTATDYPRNCCIHQLFEAQVERTPDALAVVFESDRLTYRELNDRANRLARYLQSLGVGPEVLVGICVDRSMEMIIGLLGILKAGGAYVPLNPAEVGQRLAFICQDTQASVLLTQQSLLEALPQLDLAIVCLDTDSWEQKEIAPETSPISTVTADNLAYVIYTSGSTGKPKGVPIAHCNLSPLLHWGYRHLGLTKSDRCIQYLSYHFDWSVWEIFLTLTSGASLFVPSNEEALNFGKTIDFIEGNQITILHGTPTQFQNLMTNPPSLKSLKYACIGGEALSYDLVERARQCLDGICRIFNMYGPTEATIISTVLEIERSNLDLYKKLATVSIGSPVANAGCYILNANNRLQPIGIPGELCISGDGVAAGYLNRPELTSEKFVRNSDSDFIPDDRLYKTGDLARWLPDGTIEFMGRFDHQVKIRGLRIELGEIEATLAQHPELREAVAIVREDIPGDKRIVAYLVKNSSQPTIDRLRSFLKTKLPDYMVPSAFVFLEAIPLTPNGKLDRRALPAPDVSSYGSEAPKIAPRTPTEELLAAIFMEVLALETVGIEDNFFEIGGHSLKAMQVISRVEETFSIDLPLRELFQFPTIAELSQGIEAATDARSAPGKQVKLPPITPTARNADIPLSFAQQRLWFLEQLEGKSATYNIPLAIRLEGELNLDALETALVEIVRRHEVLRTTFPSQNGSPLQVIIPAPEIALSVVELQQESEVQRLAKEEAIAPFDIATGPLVRFKLLYLSRSSSVLLLTMHHIVSDGWSLEVLFRELRVLYQGFCQQKPESLPELPIQYADFASWQRQSFTPEALKTQLDYWKQQLAGIPSRLDLPTDRPRPPVRRFLGATASFPLPVELSAELLAASRKYGATLFMTLLTAFSILLYRYSGQEDIAVGTPIANRDRPEIESLIGFFVNTLVLRTRLADNPINKTTFVSLLHRVRQTCLDAYARRDLPFEQLVEELQPDRNQSHTPLFQVMFALQNTGSESENWELPGLKVSRLRTHSGTAKFDLTLSVKETEAGLIGSWEYNTDLFDAETIARMAEHFQNLLSGIVENPQQAVGELPLLAASERHKLLVEWNSTAAEYPSNKCIHQLFEEQVERTPDAVAVVFESEQLSYRQLNDRANQLANYLQSLGVGPEVSVGICLDRSVEMVVGLLGILKAGGAYVPLDPEYPSDRLAYILSSAEIKLLVSQEKLLPSLPKHSARSICLDTDSQIIARCSDRDPVGKVRPDNLAYIIYTSGSTGQPKGVEICHKSLVNFLSAMQVAPGLSNGDSLLAVTTISFDIAALEIYLPLIVGGKTILVDRSVAVRGDRLLSILSNSGATAMQATPATWQMLLAAGWQGNPQLKILCGGEALPRELAFRLREKGSDLWNLYGPTETTVWSTACHVNAFRGESQDATFSIGTPIANTEIYILDSYLQPVPIDVAGELYIGGAGLARGYKNLPELTASKFIPNPFSLDPDSRIYKTGDLARYLPDGNIEFIGRIDNQVKIRGFRIELGEIEATLAQNPGVSAAVVIVREDIPGDKGLVAYIVPEEKGEELAIAPLRYFLKTKLPDYMVPSGFVFLDAMPLTPNGKVDRRALPAPDSSQSLNSASFVEPRDAIELQLAQIWSEVLGVGPIGVTDNFFELGGHSLLAARLMSSIRQQFGQHLSLAALFSGATISELGTLLRQETSSQSWSPLVAIQRHGSQPPLFFLPGVGGNVIYLHELARCLGKDQPFYGLQARGLDGATEPISDISEIAAYYIEAIQTVRPAGPYLLGGHSFGAVVAFEMAQQLQRQGEKVALLALLDCEAPETGDRPKPVDGDEVAKLINIARRIEMRSGQKLGISQEVLLPLDPEGQLHYFQKQLERVNLLPPNSGIERVRGIVRTMKANRIALVNYQPIGDYRGSITLLRTEGNDSGMSQKIVRDETWGWSQLSRKPVEVREVPGNHYSMLSSPHVEVLASELKSCLEKVCNN